MLFEPINYWPVSITWANFWPEKGFFEDVFSANLFRFLWYICCSQQIYVMLCAILHHLYNLKNVKKTQLPKYNFCQKSTFSRYFNILGIHIYCNFVSKIILNTPRDLQSLINSPYQITPHLSKCVTFDKPLYSALFSPLFCDSRITSACVKILVVSTDYFLSRQNTI